MIEFNNKIKALAESAETSNNFISDGKQSCYYHQLNSVLKQFSAYFKHQTPKSANCIAFECDNSLPSALTLLSLFQQGQSFILLPPSGSALKEPQYKASLPLFCDYILTVSTEKASDYQQPEAFLTLEKISNTPNIKPKLADITGKLYVRTSGSMGAAKIIVHRQHSLLHNAENYAQRYQLTPADHVAIPLPIFHLYALGAGFLSAFCTGASIRLLKNTNILSYLSMERDFKPNVAFFTPTLCEMLLKGRKASGGYRMVLTSGDRIKASVFRDFNDKFGGIMSQYGSTEMGAIAASNPDDLLTLRLETTGKAMTGMALSVNDNGVLRCKTETGFEAYLDTEGNILPTPNDDGWFTTGDLATINADGNVVILGRADNQVNRSGFLVRLSDIEEKIESISGVLQSIVLSPKGSEQQGRGQQLVAFCIIEKNFDLEVEKIRSLCFSFLPKYAIPDKIQLLKRLPLLANGKIDRQLLLTQLE